MYDPSDFPMLVSVSYFPHHRDATEEGGSGAFQVFYLEIIALDLHDQSFYKMSPIECFTLATARKLEREKKGTFVKKKILSSHDFPENTFDDFRLGLLPQQRTTVRKLTSLQPRQSRGEKNNISYIDASVKKLIYLMCFAFNLECI